MRQLIKEVMALGIAPEQITLHGNLAMTPELPNAKYTELLEEEALVHDQRGEAESAERLRAEIADLAGKCSGHVPTFMQLTISPAHDISHSLFSISYESDPARMQSIARDIQMDVGGIALHDIPAGTNGVALARTQMYQENFALVKKLIELAEEALDATIDNDMERLYQAKYQRFQMTDAYKENPCSADEYVALFIEMVDLNYVVAMEFPSYYQWFSRSAQMLGADGNLTEDARKEAMSLLAQWRAIGPDTAKSQLCRVMKVHPRHRAPFYSLADEIQGGQADAA